MKKSILFLVGIYLIAFHLNATKISPLFGFSLSKYSFSDWNPDISFSFKPSINFGGELDIILSNNISLAQRIFLSFRGSKCKTYTSSSEFASGTYRLTALSIPVLLKLQLKKNSPPYLFAGPILNLLLNHHLYLENGDDYDLKERSNSMAFAIELGLGYPFVIFRLPLFVELSYSHGLSSIIKDKEYSSIYQNSFQIILGFSPGIK